MGESDEDDTFFVIILPVTIVIFVSIFTYLFVGYMRLKKHIQNSGQVISALPFLILPDEQPEIRSPDGELPPPAYHNIVETHNDNNNTSSVDYNSSTRRERQHARLSRHGGPMSGGHPGGGYANPVLQIGEMQQSGPPSTEIMLERPPPVYSIEGTETTNTTGRIGRRERKRDRQEQIAMNDISPPPYSPAVEVPVN